MEQRQLALGDYSPVLIATLVSVALYYNEASLLLLKIGEVFGGIFDTSVPAFPLAGMLFVLLFMFLRKNEFERLLANKQRDGVVMAMGLVMAIAPLPVSVFASSTLSGSYVFAAFALVLCWTGVTVLVRPALVRFLWPYLAVYILAVGSVSVLTSVFGDPLAVVVSWIGSKMTAAMGLPVSWSSVNIAFNSAGAIPVNLYVSQECSGIASVSIFLLLIALMHLDLRPRGRTTAIFAVGGAALFIFLNSLRVVALIAAGIFGGVGLLWNLHGWLGYVLYIAGYTLLVLLYFRAKDREIRRTDMPTAMNR